MPDALPIKDLYERHVGVSEGVSLSYYEASCVCLSRHHHSPTSVHIEHPRQPADATATWDSPDERLRGAWANDIDTTEAGAYGCTIAAVELALDMRAVRRAETGSGADYYIGRPGTGIDDLEDCQRLEVSGVDNGTLSEIHRRVAQKERQVRNGPGSLPALVGVVGFNHRLIVLSQVDEAP